jgi:hypothetical protein
MLRPTVSLPVSWCQAIIWGQKSYSYYCHIVSGLLWGALSDDRTGLSFIIALVLASALILRSEFRENHDQILLSQIRYSPNLKSQVLVFIFPRNMVAQLYPQELGSLFLLLLVGWD